MRLRAIVIVVLLVGSALMALTPAPAAAKVTGDNCIETEHGTWCSETVLSDTQKYDGIGFGDADNDGLVDILGVGLSGKVWMATKKSGEWVAKSIWQSDGELLIPAIGDADNDGKNEVVVVGMVAGPEADTGAGQVTLLKYTGTSWTNTRIFTDTHMVHGVAIGDFDPDHTGNEVVVGSFSYNMTSIYGSGSTWNNELMFTAGHKIRTVVVGDVDDDGKNEVTAASKDNSIYIVEKDGGNWVNKTIYTDADGEARCGIGDYDGDGKTDVVAGGDGSRLALIKRSGSDWSGSTIFTDSDKLRGSWIGDVYDGRAGEEIVAAGYSGNVTLHFQQAGSWVHEVVFHDSARLHHVLIGDVDPDHPGMEIITAGYSNKVTVIGQYHPDFELAMDPAGAKVTTATEATFKLTISSKDFYTDELDLEVTGLPTGATATMTADPAILTSDKTVVTITVAVPASVASGNTTFKVKATGDNGFKEVSGYLDVDRQIVPKVTSPAAGEKVTKGKSITYTFTVENNGNIPDTFSINATSSNGFTVSPSMTKTSTLDPGANATVTVTFTVPKDSKAKTDVLTFKVTSDFDGSTVASGMVTTDIKKPKDKDSPGYGVLTVIVALALIGLLVGRRKR